LTIFLFDNVPF